MFRFSSVARRVPLTSLIKSYSSISHGPAWMNEEEHLRKWLNPWKMGEIEQKTGKVPKSGGKSEKERTKSIGKSILLNYWNFGMIKNGGK